MARYNGKEVTPKMGQAQRLRTESLPQICIVRMNIRYSKTLQLHFII